MIDILLPVPDTFMDMAPVLLICTPIFLPVIKSLGIDPVHFGIIMIMNLGIGLVTRPLGPSLFVGCAIGRVTMEAVTRTLWVVYIPILIVLGLVTYVPASHSGCRACCCIEPSSGSKLLRNGRAS